MLLSNYFLLFSFVYLQFFTTITSKATYFVLTTTYFYHWEGIDVSTLMGCLLESMGTLVPSILSHAVLPNRALCLQQLCPFLFNLGIFIVSLCT